MVLSVLPSVGVTVNDVLTIASLMGDTERYKARRTTCATHAMSSLPRTTDRRSLAYCDTCWTVFTDAGHIENPIDFDEIVDD